MKTVLIYNSFPCHYEVIESIIVNTRYLLNIPFDVPIHIAICLVVNETSFQTYIQNKYPDISFQYIHNPDYFIDCTIYDSQFHELDKHISNKKYIAHEVTERLQSNPNVFFLTPLTKSKTNVLLANTMPYTNHKRKNNLPIYVIQSNLNQNRRNLSLLIKILSQSYKHNFLFKLVGRGELPEQLEPYKNQIILRNNLDFINFHKEFMDTYCILPLITKDSHPVYYKSKLTSTINYATGFNLKCLIDKDLQEIYNLNNVEIFHSIDDIVQAFNNTLDEFYSH